MSNNGNKIIITNPILIIVKNIKRAKGLENKVAL